MCVFISNIHYRTVSMYFHYTYSLIFLTKKLPLVLFLYIQSPSLILSMSPPVYSVIFNNICKHPKVHFPCFRKNPYLLFSNPISNRPFMFIPLNFNPCNNNSFIYNITSAETLHSTSLYEFPLIHVRLKYKVLPLNKDPSFGTLQTFLE